MKKLSITSRITIWYTIFLIILAGAFLFILAYTGNIRASEMARSRLTDSVEDASREIEGAGESFIIDNDLNFYDDGVYISVYDDDEELIEGRRPAEVSSLPALNEGGVRKLTGDDNETWYVYDRQFYIDGKHIWVRGVVKDFAQHSSFSFMLSLSAVGFPALVILAALGGYIITRRGFRPVRNIIDTAEEISRDADLSRRIELDRKDGRKDEIYKLARTFNGMFEKLENVFSEEKQFTSDVSHELRTPLAVIITQSDYALEDEEYREKALKVINREARRMNSLVNRLLTLARSDAGRLPLNIEEIDFSAVCESVAEQQEPVAAEHDVELVTVIKPGIKVAGDEMMLIRVILNLVENAMKYGRKEDGSHSRIFISLGEEEGYACLRVRDEGKGIEEDQLERIWERFYRVDASRSEEGSGLGLSMVEALVKAHGGFVRGESSPGRGSCFSVFIPVSKNGESV